MAKLTLDTGQDAFLSHTLQDSQMNMHQKILRARLSCLAQEQECQVMCMHETVTHITVSSKVDCNKNH